MMALLDNVTCVISDGPSPMVFLNFRGDELRYSFVSHLIDAFERDGINFFVDEYEQRGKDLETVFERIHDSSIALAIFSARYTESSFCMDELVKMKNLTDKGELIVIPIFYKVEAEDVGKPKSDSEFGKNFWRLVEESRNGDQMNKWIEALQCISKKLGLSLREKSSEADFVKKIVKDVQIVIEKLNSRKTKMCLSLGDKSSEADFKEIVKEIVKEVVKDFYGSSEAIGLDEKENQFEKKNRKDRKCNCSCDVVL